jgi:hypothetical protein
VVHEAKEAVERSGDSCGQFVLELAESGLNYADGRFAPALELVQNAQRSGRVAAGEPGLSPQYWRILQARRQIARPPSRNGKPGALHIFETGRAGQLLQTGKLADAGDALGKLFTCDVAPQVVSVLDAAGVVAMGRVAIHTGDRSLARQAADIAQVMLAQDAPSTGGSGCGRH